MDSPAFSDFVFSKLEEGGVAPYLRCRRGGGFTPRIEKQASSGRSKTVPFKHDVYSPLGESAAGGANLQSV